MEHITDLRYQRTFKWSKSVEWKYTPQDEKQWVVELIGKRGKVYPYNDKTLVAYTPTRQSYRKLLSLPFVTKHRDCMPVEAEILFPSTPENLKAVGAVLRLKKRPGPKSLSDTHKDRIREASKRTQFTVDKDSSKA